ncbi:MAG TPA: IS200/IS605 family transposase [Candidatus Acidoferrales bacterium]|nr:IS200/IS605 family transposase [Candidatus Acidoferrales bacterium]
MELDLAPQVKQALEKDWEPLYRSQLHYLVTWNTRGRRPVLKEKHIEALHGLIRQTCEERDFELVEVVAGQDHVHVLFGLRPAQSVASAVRELKGRTSMTLMGQHPELRVWLRGNLLWDERYTVETVSPLRVDRIRDRLSSVHRTLFGCADTEPLAEAS